MTIRKILSSKKFFYSCFLLTILFIGFLSFIYFKHATTFNFVDEYTNIIAAFFMHKGRTLYTDIFFHHQLFMPYLSFVYQLFITPNTLYELIVHHRLIVIAFAFIMNILLIYRFRYVGIGFVLFFEPLKYYLFGNLFLAEAFIVYPIVYLLGLIWESLSQKKIHTFETITAAICTWFVLFMREPYVPLVLIMYLLLLWKNRPLKRNYISVAVFLVLTIATIFTTSINDFIYQVILVNALYVIPNELNNSNRFLSILISFVYPVSILFENQWNFYRVVLICLDLVFLGTIGYLAYKKYSLYKLAFFLFLLGLANIRWVSSITNFYIAYHALPWFASFCFLLFIFLKEIYHINRKTARVLTVAIACIFLGMMLYPKSYIWENPNRQEQFTINYSRFYVHGMVINRLSDENDTVFIDYWDSLVYWEADKDSSYKYAMYYPVTGSIPQFIEERRRMFYKNPPDFYYSDCGKKNPTTLLPNESQSAYSFIYYNKKPSCLLIKKQKVAELTSKQLEDLKALGYTIPDTSN